MLLAVPNNASFEQQYIDDFEAVKRAVDELVDCTGGQTKIYKQTNIYIYTL